ncbi:MAG: hypothetical protein ACRDJ5_03680 [Actinomycetota bacterium]
MEEIWRVVLVVALCVNALLGLGYRVFRLSKGGPLGDVVGQSILAGLLLIVALALALGIAWTRWLALGYGVVFGVAVMPVWVLAVLIPMRPRAPDYAFTGLYWSCLALVVVGALLA